MSQQGLILVHTEKLKPEGPISEKLVSSDISHVAFASVLLRENPSEEVDDYDDYITIIMNLSQETTVFGGRQKLTSCSYGLKARKVVVDFKFDAVYS